MSCSHCCSHHDGDRLIVELFQTISRRLDIMDSRIKVIEDGVVAEQASIGKLGAVVPLLVGLLTAQGAALADAQQKLAAQPSDAEIASVGEQLGGLKSQTDALVTALQSALPASSGALTVSPASLTVAVGAPSHVSATVPDGSTPTWSTSDESIATVDDAGVVTGVAEGTATITAHDAAGETADCVVTVVAAS